MRTIKFRAWDKKNKKMIGGFGIDSTFGYAFIKDFDLGEEYILECEIMQFTGLTDKNGKEIYEGDIVKNERHKFITNIEYYGGAFRCFSEGMPLSLYIDECYADKDINNQLEVIGNIYENPNLLN
jgi:uncharacterized phage protein (TIGR01671 family)